MVAMIDNKAMKEVIQKIRAGYQNLIHKEISSLELSWRYPGHVLDTSSDMAHVLHEGRTRPMPESMV
jgi:hypothetical protein